MFSIRKRDPIDVTDQLDDGAKAIVTERTERLLDARARWRLAAAERDAHPLITLSPPTTVGYLAKRTARAYDDAVMFEDGRAYERGANIARRVNAKAATRERSALSIATTYLTAGDPRRAALVLAGFTGADPAQVA